MTEKKCACGCIDRDCTVDGMSARELAAIISAAIAAENGSAKVNFRIKSIKRLEN